MGSSQVTPVEVYYYIQLQVHGERILTFTGQLPGSRAGQDDRRHISSNHVRRYVLEDTIDRTIQLNGGQRSPP